MKTLNVILISILTTIATMLLVLWQFDLIGISATDTGGEITVGGVRDVETLRVTNQEDAQIEAVEKVTEAIVGVIAFQQQEMGIEIQNRAVGEGSGIVYKVENGNTYIATNEHVVSSGNYFEVVFNNDANTRVEATVVGMDAYTDIAVLRVEGYEAETVATFGNTEDLRIGQTVIAIGNPLGLGFAGSATMGVVSGHDRSVSMQIISNDRIQEWEMTVLQTDAAINPGNSGGALINLNGEVVGINSMKIASEAVEGMSFSIPTYIALPIVRDLEEYGEVIRPTLGISLFNMSAIPDIMKSNMGISEDIRTGIFVNEVANGGLADNMGMAAGDVITHIGEIEVIDTMKFRQELFTYREGDELKITVLRNGEEIELTATVVIVD